MILTTYNHAGPVGGKERTSLKEATTQLKIFTVYMSPIYSVDGDPT